MRDQLAKKGQVTISRGSLQRAVLWHITGRNYPDLRNGPILVLCALAKIGVQTAQKTVEVRQIRLLDSAERINAVDLAHEAREEGENELGLATGLVVPLIVLSSLAIEVLAYKQDAA